MASIGLGICIHRESLDILVELNLRHALINRINHIHVIRNRKIHDIVGKFLLDPWSCNMLAIIKGAFIKPVLMYSKQVEANERALRIKKVATKQRTVDSAD